MVYDTNSVKWDKTVENRDRNSQPKSINLATANTTKTTEQHKKLYMDDTTIHTRQVNGKTHIRAID